MTWAEIVRNRSEYVLKVGLWLSLSIVSVGSFGFIWKLPHDVPKWSYVLLRVGVYASLTQAFLALLAVMVSRYRLRAIGFLFVALSFYSCAGYLTEGEPQSIPYPQSK